MQVESTESTTVGGVPATKVQYKGTGGYNPRAFYIDGCTYCDSERRQGESCFPDHFASTHCESGGRSHCSCDRCF